MEILNKPQLTDKQIEELRKVGAEFAFSDLEPERFNAKDSIEMIYFMEGYNSAKEIIKNSQEITSNKATISM